MVKVILDQYGVEDAPYYRVRLTPHITYHYLFEKLFGYDRFMTKYSIVDCRNGNLDGDNTVLFWNKDDAEKFVDWLDAHILARQMSKETR